MPVWSDGSAKQEQKKDDGLEGGIPSREPPGTVPVPLDHNASSTSLP